VAACAGAALATAILILLGRGGPAGLGTEGQGAAVATGGSTSAAERLDARAGRTADASHLTTLALGDLDHALSPLELAIADAAPAIVAGRDAAPLAAEGLERGVIALIVSADGLDAGLDALRQAMQRSAPANAALVRNVTLREAADFDLRLRVAASGKRGAPAQASAAGQAGQPGAREAGPVDAGNPPIGAPRDSTAAALLGEHIAGSPAAATAPEVQLTLSEDGYTYSVTLPVEHLRDLLIALAFDERVRLQLGRREELPVATAAAGREVASPAEAWQRWQRATAAMMALERGLPTGTMVTLAVRVDSARR
jgi:hypothetical protein